MTENLDARNGSTSLFHFPKEKGGALNGNPTPPQGKRTGAREPLNDEDSCESDPNYDQFGSNSDSNQGTVAATVYIQSKQQHQLIITLKSVFSQCNHLAQSDLAYYSHRLAVDMRTRAISTYVVISLILISCVLAVCGLAAAALSSSGTIVPIVAGVAVSSLAAGILRAWEEGANRRDSINLRRRQVEMLTDAVHRIRMKWKLMIETNCDTAILTKSGGELLLSYIDAIQKTRSICDGDPNWHKSSPL